MLKRPLLFLLGVVLPVITLLIEIATAMSAEVYLDPIPTWWHVGLVAAIPAVNAWILTRLARPSRDGYELLFWANGISIGIAGIYAAAFVPISMFALIAVIWFGVGLLPLSPILALCASIVITAALHRAAYDGQMATARRHVRATTIAVVLGVGLFLCGDIPFYVTRTTMASALSNDGAERIAGRRALRRWGWRDELLRQCYRTQADIRPSTHHFREVARDDAQRVFFQVAGTPFNEAHPDRFSGVEPRFFSRGFDEALGGESVAGQRRNLSLDASTMTVDVYPEQQLAYTEWTFEFYNGNSWQEEARAQILLPPGGVVSRLTLWVNGEPREAAFAGTAQVQAAYQEIAVVRQCDPVLVTWKGSDRVYMQCFPVPPKDRMRVRIGVTLPLELSSSHSSCRLPHFIEQNFKHAWRLKHEIMVQAASASVIVDPADTSGDLAGQVEMKIADASLAATSIRIQHSSFADGIGPLESTARDGDHRITQVIRQHRVSPAKRICFVVDGSKAMRRHFSDLADAILSSSARAEVQLLLVGDETHDLSADVSAHDGRSSSRELAAQMRKLVGRGGFDNVPALLESYQKQRFAEDAAIVWLHGPVPLELSPISALWTLDQDPHELLIYDIQVGRGPNRVAEHWESKSMRQRVWQHDTFKDQLAKIVNELLSETVHWDREFSRTAFSAEETTAEPTPAEQHLAELWASRDVHRLLDQAYEENRDEAIRLAEIHHLVTPVTGAVVLETDQQYLDSGLTPVDASSKSAINTPEPSSLTLGLFALFGFWGYARRLRRWRPNGR